MTNLATTIAPICLLAAGTALAADKALVIGIDDYPGVALPRPLSTAADDARAMRDHLVADLGFAAEDVTLLTDGAATAEGIVGALLADLVGGTSEGDRALVYFAGLGGRIATSDAAEIDAYEEYLLAHGDGDPFALIPEGALIELLDRLEGRAVTVIIDASMTAPRMSVLRDGDAVAPRAAAFGASEVASRNVADADLGALGRETFMESPFGAGRGAAGRDVWVAAAPSQVAWETPAGGVFTRAWIDGMASGAVDMNANGSVSNAELLVHLREASERWCAAVETCDATGLGLTPDFSGDVMGYVAALDPNAAAPAPTPAAPSRDTMKAFVTDLFAASNPAGLAITVETGSPMRLGDTVRFTVETERAGTLLLLDVNPEGELFQIFPSRLSPEGRGRIAAGATLAIPGPVANTGRPMQITVTEPAGEGLLVALLVESDAPVFERLLPENLELDPIPNATQYLYEIVQSLLQMQVGPDGNAAVEWSATYSPYTILR